MRSRIAILFVVFTVGSLALPIAAHAGIPFFGPIIPQADPTCPLGWGAVILVINNIIELLLTLAIVFVAPIMIAYSGFLFVVNPVNPSGKEKAKGILLNTVVGIVIALAGWLIVDAIMAVLYNSTTPVSDGSTLKTWSSIITSGGLPACLPQTGSSATQGRGAATVVVPPPNIVTTSPATNVNGFYTSSQCGDSNTRNVQILTASGVRGSSTGSCCMQNSNRCTSLTGMRNSTVLHVKEIQRVCGNVTVTGGTEVGHSDNAPGGKTHESGYKVDLAPNIDSCITQYTTAVAGAAGTRSDGALVRTDRCGNNYARESSHWDITINTTAACSLR